MRRAFYEFLDHMMDRDLDKVTFFLLQELADAVHSYERSHGLTPPKPRPLP